MPITLGILAQSRQAVAAGAFDLLETQVLGSAQSSVTFASLNTLAAGYKHLQVRFAARSDVAGTNPISVWSRLNGDGASNYSWHIMFGNGSSVSSSGAVNQIYALTGTMPQSGNTANAFGVGVIDLLDPFVTTKNKTFRSLTGYPASSNRIDLLSGNWRNTAAATSWQLLADSGNFVIGSRFSLYGVK